MSKPKANEIRIDPDLKAFFGEPISVYTSEQAEEDGFLFDVDQLIKAGKIKPVGLFPLKYITTGLLGCGYWKDRCDNAVKLDEAGKNDRCQSCPTWHVFATTGHKKLPCTEQELSIPNLLDLISQALRIFAKKPKDDYFVSGRVELPSGKKQIIYIAQNETGRYTAMLPEEY